MYQCGAFAIFTMVHIRHSVRCVCFHTAAITSVTADLLQPCLRGDIDSSFCPKEWRQASHICPSQRQARMLPRPFLWMRQSISSLSALLVIVHLFPPRWTCLGQRKKKEAISFTSDVSCSERKTVDLSSAPAVILAALKKRPLTEALSAEKMRRWCHHDRTFLCPT